MHRDGQALRVTTFHDCPWYWNEFTETVTGGCGMGNAVAALPFANSACRASYCRLLDTMLSQARFSPARSHEQKYHCRVLLPSIVPALSLVRFACSFCFVFVFCYPPHVAVSPHRCTPI